jgi:hypothetical protein
MGDRVKFTATARSLGIISAAVTVILVVAYAVTLTMGLLFLKSPQQPIGDPRFTILEVLIILMMPAMVARWSRSRWQCTLGRQCTLRHLAGFLQLGLRHRALSERRISLSSQIV